MDPFLKRIFRKADAGDQDDPPSWGSPDIITRLQEALVASPEVAGQLRMVENLEDLAAFRAVYGDVLDEAPDEVPEPDGHFRRAIQQQQETS